MQGRKHSHQPSIREIEKIQVVENTMPPPRDEARIQVVAFEVPADNAILIAVGGVEGVTVVLMEMLSLRRKSQNKINSN